MSTPFLVLLFINKSLTNEIIFCFRQKISTSAKSIMSATRNFCYRIIKSLYNIPIVTLVIAAYDEVSPDPIAVPSSYTMLIGAPTSWI